MINNILRDREARYEYILKLIEKYSLPVICGKVNYPGPDKNTSTANKIFNILSNSLFKEFSAYIKFSKLLEGYDGKSLVMVVNLDEIDAKRKAIKLEEESKIGRLYDIDVYSLKGIPLSRKALGFEARKCIICNEEPWLCRRLNKHKLTELLKEYR